MNLFQKMQQALTALSYRADAAAIAKMMRVLVTAAGRKVRNVAEFRQQLANVGRAVKFMEGETGSWVTAAEFRDGKTGPFDACDLRHWLQLAELADVAYVPAKEILHLTEDEMAIASGKVEFPETVGAKRTLRVAGEFVKEEMAKANDEAGKADASGGDEEETLIATAAQMIAGAGKVDAESLERRLFDAMDEVPEGWMVRSARCGASNLKTLAGAGHIGEVAPEIRFGVDLEIGPGWVRRGNRRRVHVSDHRTVEAAAQGPVGGSSFLARPWQKSARYLVTQDPERHGTPFAGKGVWPAEWRAFVEDGKVVGVSFYYAWAGEVSAENAEIALVVRDAAQKIADKAAELNMWPRYLDVEFVRSSTAPNIKNDASIQAHLDHFGREKVACTLDFIETDEGLKLLEGGPANTPFGGGHPCGFAGCGGQPRHGNKTETDGVAFRLMPHVLMSTPKTWEDGDREGCILSWDAVDALLNPSNGMTV